MEIAARGGKRGRRGSGGGKEMVDMKDCILFGGKLLERKEEKSKKNGAAHN